MKKQTSVSPNMVSLTKRKPINLEIVSSPERTSLINSDLDKIILDSSSACDYNSYVDPDGSTFMRIECQVSQEEKVRA